MFALHTSAVDEDISIKSISEENYILLIFEIYVRPCEEVWVKTERTEYSSQFTLLLESLVVFFNHDVSFYHITWCHWRKTPGSPPLGEVAAAPPALPWSDLVVIV